MQAVRGVYRNGVIEVDKKLPYHDMTVLVVFVSEDTMANEQDEMSTDEALHLLQEFRGCITRSTDYETERDEYLHEKYGCAY